MTAMYLHHLNPSLKALTIVLLVILIAFIFEPLPPFIFLIWTILFTFLFGKVNWKRYILFFIPFLIFSFGMLWTAVVFGDSTDPAGDTVQLLGMELYRENLMTSLALSLRVLVVASLSLLFIFTTNVIDFILSMIQQLRLPPKIAYAVLAGYRFLPLLRDELKIIQDAHRVRGLGQGRSWKEKMARYRMYVIPLLASAIRKAERTAVAMESKGFTGEKGRTFYRTFQIRKIDWFFPVAMLSGFIVALLL